MNDRRLRLAFVVFHYTLGLVVLIQSLVTAYHAFATGAGPQQDPHVGILASVEAVAAVLFLVPRTVRIGGGLLLAVFAVAVAVHAVRGEFASTLVAYAAAVVFVMVHGPAFPSHTPVSADRVG
jgi:hypothetical protein